LSNYLDKSRWKETGPGEEGGKRDVAKKDYENRSDPKLEASIWP